MKLIPCKKSELKKATRTPLYRLIKEFAESGCECAEVYGGSEHYCTPNCGANTINRAIKNYKVPQIKAIVNNGEIYLIKEL
jgi:hypothetical protein